jgi:hypothetical protein
MKQVVATIVLMLYAVSSAGVVFVEYSCHETGTSGVTAAGPRACYAPACGDRDARGAMRQADTVCDGTCCDIHVRASAPDDQFAGAKPGLDIAGERVVVCDTTPLACECVIAASNEPSPAGRFPGFDPPLLA